MRNGRVLTVALSKFSKADQDLLSATFADVAKHQDGEPTGAEFLKEALVRASETFPNETQVRREFLIKERIDEFHQKYDNCNFNLRFDIQDISTAPNGYFLQLDVMQQVAGGKIRYNGAFPLKLTAEDAKKISKGDTLHIVGNVTLLLSGEKHVNNGSLFSYENQLVRFYFDKPSITIEQTKRSTHLKDVVAARVAELRKLEAAESRQKNNEHFGEDERASQIPDNNKEAEVVGDIPPPPLPTKLEDPFRQPESYRVWADTKGHSVEAVFVEHKGLNITLRRHDGKEITLPISTFSRDDLEWMLKEGK